MMALRRLRFPDRSRFLWIDQLCIDQENNEEKGPQIQLMSYVYQTAQQVIIWLGEDRDFYLSGDAHYIKGHHSQLLPETITSLSTSESQDEYRSQTAALVDVRLGYLGDTIEQQRWTMIIDILRRPWFSRAWVFQEASLATHLKIQFGELEADFQKVKQLCEVVTQIEKDLGMGRDHTLRATTPGFEMMQLIDRCRKERLQDVVNRTDSQSSYFLNVLLQVLRRVRCFDRRDLIFAFLAFQNGEGIRATAESYSQPIEEIWTNAAESIIKSSKSLDIFAALSGETSRHVDLPSWVPYWADPFPYSRPIATSRTYFKASRNLPHIWHAHSDPWKLQVRGKIIDKIVSGSDQYAGPSFARGLSQGQPMEIFLMFDLLIEHYEKVYYADEAIAAAHGVHAATKLQIPPRDMMRIVLADGALGTKQPLRETIDDMLDIYNQRDAMISLRCAKTRLELSSSEFRSLQIYEQLEDLVLVAEHKIHFATQHFQHGLAPNCIKVGDYIAIIHGSRTPCVLRLVNEDKKEYKIVGQCYLDGWMYGKPRATVPRAHPHGNWWEEEQDEFVLV
ncbi:heterokaryon incompatibility protein-domain-containing protein [Paraphoma chrysanthemicola]|uniref:Heterokaryon incompatibility protein-domain-containing protein n=1 Tax=Paraphoma chrysanthemicola TaxID=798071 RepID=A0A8K0RBP4_9PLEO|nr:heterokaryon incompatibility protein-domain-containing protein [Paraphoma chrysanthemicola]